MTIAKTSDDLWREVETIVTKQQRHGIRSRDWPDSLPTTYPSAAEVYVSPDGRVLRAALSGSYIADDSGCLTVARWQSYPLGGGWRVTREQFDNWYASTVRAA